jgi:hypothetical protein
VATFFAPSIQCIVEAVKEQSRVAHKPFTVRPIGYHVRYSLAKVHVQHVVLVGGFASSDWLYNCVSAALEPEGFIVIRPENHLYAGTLQVIFLLAD